MKVNIYILITFFSFLGCNEFNDNLQLLNNKNKIYEKDIAFKKDDIEVEDSRIENVNGINYIVEEKTIYDSKGILYLYTGGSEGFIIHSRNNEKGSLPIENKEQYKELKIDRNHNYIIDGQDTIRKFKILLKEKIILTNEIKDNRIHIYRFN